MHAPARPGPDRDPLAQARALVGDALTALLDVEATAEQERAAAAGFVTELEQLIDALVERPETAAAVPALSAAADHLRAGETAGDDELADLLGLDRLPATLRRVHSRITGPPTSWSGEHQR
jgi:hypothetical protein